MSADDKRPRMNHPHLTRTAAKGKISLKQPIEMIMYGTYNDVHHYFFRLVNEAGDTCSETVERLPFKVKDELWQTFLSNKQRFKGNVSSGDKVTVMFNGSATKIDDPHTTIDYPHAGETYVIE